MGESEPSSELGFGTGTAAAILVLSALLFAGLIFGPAGRLDWPAGWLCLAVMLIGFSAVTGHVAARTPSLIRRRARIGAGTPWWDRVLVPIFQLAFVAVLAVAGLDAGRHSERALPVWAEAAGLLAMIAAIFVLGWAMGRNPHFESTVRIQSDRGHRVIESGPTGSCAIPAMRRESSCCWRWRSRSDRRGRSCPHWWARRASWCARGWRRRSCASGSPATANSCAARASG
jgi:protein-S-isoprenylcysteine O-methyltransferase Ste14